MAFKSLKNKISNMAGGEILGKGDLGNELEQEKEISSPPAPPRQRKHDKISMSEESSSNQGQPRKESKPGKQRKSNLFNRKEMEIEETHKMETPKPTKKEKKVIEIPYDAIEGYDDVLSILGIKESINLELEFNSDDLDYVEFTQTQPLGFDFDEVTDFITRIKYNLYKMERALLQRDKDIVKVASEVKKVEQKMMEAQHEKELERMIGGMTKEEMLIEENMDLKVEINELKMQIGNLNDNTSINQLKKEIEVLQTENNMLKSHGIGGLGGANKGMPDLPSMPNIPEVTMDSEMVSMPDLSELDKKEKTDGKLKPIDNEDDFLQGLLNDIGGLYDDE